MTISEQSTFAVITARGGSKRIKNKNIRLFYGKPIIAYSIETAIESQLFERIIVTTDSPEIAEIAKDYGAEIPFMRDATLADDMTGTVEVINDAITQMKEQGSTYPYTCCIYPAAPLMTANDLAIAYEILIAERVDYVFPVYEQSSTIYRSLKKTKDGRVAPIFESYTEYRSQDLPAVYSDAGQFYWGKSESFLHNKSIHNSDNRVIVLPSDRACDIDCEDDWARAEQMYQNLTYKI